MTSTTRITTITTKITHSLIPIYYRTIWTITEIAFTIVIEISYIADYGMITQALIHMTDIIHIGILLGATVIHLTDTDTITLIQLIHHITATIHTVVQTTTQIHQNHLKIQNRNKEECSSTDTVKSNTRRPLTFKIILIYP